MLPFNKRFIAIVIFIGVFALLSGCTSPQKDNSTNLAHISSQSTIMTSNTPFGEKFMIQIDHIPDFQTDSTFNITGLTQLNVRGTTNFPAGTPLRFELIEGNESRSLIRTTIKVISNNSGTNTFSYVYDMKGNLPGQYRIILKNESNRVSANIDFSITSDKPYYKWIRMDPIGIINAGERIPVSGTTDLPAGSEILIRSEISYHTCTIPTPDTEGQRSFCGGSCRDTGSRQITLVAEGPGGINIWNSTIDTSNWCLNEEYRINAFANNWTNVTQTGQSVRFNS